MAEADGAGFVLLFPGGRLDHVDLHGVDLSKVDVSRADLSYANLAGASLASARLDSTNLAHADLTDTDLTDAWFQGVRAWGLAGCPATPPGYTSKNNTAEWVCVKTPAGGFALIGGAADLSGADLSGADLSKVEAHELWACPKVLPTHAWQCVAEPQVPDGSSVFALLGPGAALDEAELRQAVLTDLDLTGASLRGAYLDGAVLRRVDLTGADLSNAYDPGVTFDAVTFKNTTCPDGTLSDKHQDTCAGH